MEYDPLRPLAEAGGFYLKCILVSLLSLVSKASSHPQASKASHNAGHSFLQLVQTRQGCSFFVPREEFLLSISPPHQSQEIDIRGNTTTEPVQTSQESANNFIFFRKKQLLLRSLICLENKILNCIENVVLHLR